MGEAKQRQTESQNTFLAQVTSVLASVKFAVTVVIVITLACVAGTILPQGADVLKYVERFPAASARMDLFSKLGLTHVFTAWWFLALLGVLAASMASCSARRFTTVRRTTGYARRRALGSMLTHISLMLILTGGLIRGGWGMKGYLEFHEGQTVAQFVAERGVQRLPFALHLAKFDIETYAAAGAKAATKADDGRDQLVVKWPAQHLVRQLPVDLGAEQVVGEGANAFRIKILKYIPDFVIDMATHEVTSRSDEPRNPAVLVAVVGPAYANHRWLFAKFPDFTLRTPDSQATPDSKSGLEMVYINHGAPAGKKAITGPVKNFRSTLTVIEDNAVTHEQTIAVNSPMRYKGYTFYQSGYDPRDLSYTSLQVVRDPGVPVVYAGFSLMIAGLFLVFYLNPLLEGRRFS